jgi:hypothetical protein
MKGRSAKYALRNTSIVIFGLLLSQIILIVSASAQDREAEIRDLLTHQNGIDVKDFPCTQVGGLLKSSVLELIAFKKIYPGPLTVTGGNEDLSQLPQCLGDHHKPDSLKKNHLTGWKVDLRIGIENQANPDQDALSTFVKGFPPLGPRGDHCSPQRSKSDDCAPQYQCPSSLVVGYGSIFALEYPVTNLKYFTNGNNHWDVLFYVDHIDAKVNGQTNPTAAIPLPMGSSVPIEVKAYDLAGNDIGLVSNDYLWTSNDPSIALVDDSGNVTGVRQGSTMVFAFQGVDTFQVVTFVVQQPLPPPPQPGGTWQWDPNANGGTGAWSWVPNPPPSNCTGNCNPPPPGGGTPPPPGTCSSPTTTAGPCWIWNPSNGTWSFVPPQGGSTTTGTKVVNPVSSLDPNDIAGPDGVGVGNYVAAGQPFTYAIFFENLQSATAPAQTVLVSDPLPNSFDPSTITLGPISLGSVVVTPPIQPLSLAPYTTTVDLRPILNVLLSVTASIDSSASKITWSFTSLDPATGLPVTDPLTGFLPPGAGGSVSFIALAKAGLATGTALQNQATIVFDVNAPLSTPLWTNTIDNSNPVSKVLALASTQTSTDFNVQWNGSDTGSGIRDFSVYVSDNGAPFVPWRKQTFGTTATFHGVQGHSYSFYSIARDLTGNVENAKITPDATTRVIIDTTPPVVSPNVVGTLGMNGWYRSDVTVTWAATDAESGIVSSLGCAPVTLRNETLGVTVTCSAVNGVGLTKSASITIKIDKTPPEAFIQFDLASKDIVVIGRDSLSGAPQGPVVPISLTRLRGDNDDDDHKDGRHSRDADDFQVEIRNYSVFDLAGNSLSLVEKVRKQEHQIRVSIVSLQYNNSPVLTPAENQEVFEWELAKDGSLKELIQRLENGVGKDRQELDARFEAEKNLTIIERERPKPETRVIKPRLVLVDIATDKDRLVLEF